MHAWAKARESPRFSPKAISEPVGVWILSAPSAPACMSTTTTSAFFAAFSTSFTAAGMSLMLGFHE